MKESSLVKNGVWKGPPSKIDNNSIEDKMYGGGGNKIVY